MMASDNDHIITVYEPDHVRKAGLGIWAEMFREIWTARGLVWRLIVRDIVSRYRQSMLGIAWAFLSPLPVLLAFVWMKERTVLSIGETGMPYPVFLFLGQMVWLLFSHGVTVSTGSLVSAGSLLTKINFPREALVLASLGQAVFEFAIRLPLLLAIFIWSGFIPKASILLLPVALFPLLLLITGVGLIFALFNALVRDVGSIVGMAMTIGMFATPVVYPPPAGWPLSFWVNHANPVSAFVTATRDLAVSGRISEPSGYAVSALISVIIFLAGWRMFHLAESKIAEKV